MISRVFTEELRTLDENLVLCRCGKPAHPQYGNRCENCWADDISHLFSDAYKETEDHEPNFLCMTVAELGLPTRIANKLECAGITTAPELIGKTRDRLSKIKGLGIGAIKSIVDRLAELGFKLSGE